MKSFNTSSAEDRIMRIWGNWFEDEYNCDLDSIDYYELMYEIGMEEFVDFILQEFPHLEDGIGFDYDPKWGWEEFEYTKHGYDIKSALMEKIGEYKIDNSLVLEYVGDDVIAESYLDGGLDDFFEKSKIGKKMSAKDKKVMERAFLEGTCETFSNGYSFCLSEYVEVVMSDCDEEGHDTMDIHKYVHEMRKNPSVWVMDTYLTNPRLCDNYNGDDVYTCIQIDLDELGARSF